MKVGIDISPVVYGRGVSRYTSNLVLSLAKQAEVDLALYGTSLRQHAKLAEFAQQVQKTSRRPVATQIEHLPPRLLELLWGKLKVRELSGLLPNLNVFHGWDWLMPPDKNLALVSTIHDLAILRYPETAHPKVLAMHRQAWVELQHKQAEIIAVSHSTKRDIVELLHFPAHKVHVIYEALPMETVQVAENLTEEREEEIATRLQLTQPFLFFVGTREPRKNLSRLIKAWEPLAKQVQLIIAGASGWDESSQELAKLSEAAKNQLRFLGHVNDTELAVLYEKAEMLVYPCLYEGFGLPILEAFYHGIPVVTSNVSGMQEVAGNAAELADPNSIESIRAAIERVLSENHEQQQLRLQKMVIRLQLFDWSKVARETTKVYQIANQRNA